MGKSVSRVGGKAQHPAYRSVSGDLRLSYAQFEELETFARFSTRLDKETRATIERGRRVREVLKQNEHQPLRASEQMAVLRAVNAGLLDRIPLEQMAEAEKRVQAHLLKALPELCRRMETGDRLGDRDWQRVLNELEAALRDFPATTADQSHGITGTTE